MKKWRYMLVLALLGTVTACSSEKSEDKEKKEKKEEQKEEVKEEVKEEIPAIDVEATVAKIDARRTEIETGEFDKKEVSTKDLREKIKQKWEKIHFYSKDGVVVRIKTYPYASISSRTEEFYFDNGNLILAVVEDNGMGEKGKAKADLDKMYYYHEGAVISEHNSEKEKEYSIKSSDGEELMEEVNEYLEIFKSH